MIPLLSAILTGYCSPEISSIMGYFKGDNLRREVTAVIGQGYNPYMPMVLFVGRRQIVQTQTRLTRVFTVCLQIVISRFEYKRKKNHPTSLKTEMDWPN